MLLKDNFTAWQMNSEGSYAQVKPRAGTVPYIGQKELVKLLA
jgi:hypothetical protein